MRFARTLGLLGIVVAAVVPPGPAAASPDNTFNFHFKGPAGSAVLTDCGRGEPVGTRCRAVNVFAFEQQVNNDGDRSNSGPGLSVTLFDVEIVDAIPPFIVTPIGGGFTTDATVAINTNLRSGRASAASVPLCDAFPCAPGAVEAVSISIEWVGQGPTNDFKSHDMHPGPFCIENSHTTGSIRSADATAVVNGVVFVEPAAEFGFDSTLENNKFITVVRCPAP